MEKKEKSWRKTVFMDYSDMARAQSSSGGIMPVTSFLVDMGSATMLSIRPLYLRFELIHCSSYFEEFTDLILQPMA